MKELLAHLEAQVANERAIAREHLARVDIARAWEEAIPATWRTAGFVYEACDGAAARLEQSPGESARLAHLALAALAVLPQGAYPRPILLWLEARAWRELAMAHRYQSQYEAALRALDQAARAADQSPALAYEAALVAYARAVVLADARRFPEATGTLDAACAAFASFGDAQRVLRCGILRAMIAQRQGALLVARSAYEDLLPGVERQGDVHTLAAVYNNLGQVCADLGESVAASEALYHARALFSDLEMPGEVARVLCGIASILRSQADLENAALLFEDARSRFLELGLPEEAGLAGLDLVETLLVAGKQGDAHALAQAVIAEFAAAGLPERLMGAIAYLRETLPDLQAGQVRRVRTYLVRAARDPDLLFLPRPA